MAYLGYKLFSKLLSNLTINVNDKTVLVTGCDTGMGRRTALRLAGKGMKVYAGCLTSAGVEALKKQESINIHPFLLDVTSSKSIEKLEEMLKQHCPKGLWAVINNAGIYRSGLHDIVSMDHFRATIDVNVVGLAAVTKACIPFLRKASGRIVNISSVVGFLALPGQSVYSASKYAVEGLSDSWRRELRKSNITVVIVEPGIMKTELYDYIVSKEYSNSIWNTLTEEQKNYYGREYVDHSPKKIYEVVQAVNGNPEQVVDGIEQAVVSRYPQIRYTIGKDTFFWWLGSVLPTEMADFIFSLTMRKKPKGEERK